MARADAARRDAEEANQTKDQFLAVLGHELRNPLAPALTALELMKQRDPDVFRREREVLERQVAHMARLVNDLLDVSRLARGKVQLDRRRFELREAVDRALDMTRPTIAQHRHTLDVSVPASGLDDRWRRRSDRPGAVQPADQCGEVHTPWWPHRTHCGGVGRLRRHRL